MAEQSNRIQFLKDALKNLSSAVREVSNGLIDLEKVISRLSGKTREFAKEQQKAAQSVNRVGKNLKDTAKTVDEYGKKTEKASKSQKGFFGGIAKNLKTIVSFYGAYQVLNLALSAFTELTIGSIRESIKFEKELANLSAVAGASGKAVKQLGENALEVAGKTKFTATEIIGLQTALAKLGFTSNEIIESTQGIANAAQALGTPLEEMAEQIGKVINQFGLIIEQSDLVGDVLVTTINNSALSFESFGTAMQYVGPIAKTLGLTLEQTAGAMSVLADNGFSASRIGTGLRGIFIELGKTTADVEDSLRDLAKENLSLSEAVDLVGKRNAAQLITLLDNIDALDEGTGSYYQQGRALESAAKSVDNFSGQMDLLNSAFKEFQIRSGFFIANSDIILRILDNYFPAAAKTARGFEAINKVGFEGFNKGAKDVADGANALNVALRLLNISEEEYSETLKNLGNDLAYVRRNANSTILEIEGLRDKLIEVGEQGRQQSLILQGQTQASNKYEDSVKKLTQAFKDGANVNDEVNKLSEEINQKINEYNSIIETSIKNETDLFTGKTKAVEVSQDEILVYKGLTQALIGYNKQLTNAVVSQRQLQRIFDEAERKAFKSDLELIQDDLETRLDSINAITDTELSGAKSAEEAAEIRLKQEKLIQAAYAESVRQVLALTGTYPKLTEEIENAAGKYEKFTQFTQTAIGTEGVKIIQDYKKEFGNLGKQLSNGEISLGEYAKKEDELEASLIDSITTLKNNTEANEELKDMLDKIVIAYLNAKKSANEYINTTEETTDKIKILGKEFANNLTIEEAIGMSLATTSDIISDFNDTALENTKARLDSEKDLIENRYQVEQDILKSQLDNQLITESQYRRKQKELRESQIAEENAIDKKIFDAEKKRDRQKASTDYLQAIASIIPNMLIKGESGDPVTLSLKAALSTALATAAYGAELAAIGQRKFFPKKFEQGGMVSGPSHSQGGVPFSVQGQGGYEMEGGEFIVNKRATAKHYDLLQRINDSYRTAPKMGRMKFADGGLINSPMNESVDYLKAIAEATTSTAIGVSKPVRAYVSDKDLRTNATERRIRDRNDRL